MEPRTTSNDPRQPLECGRATAPSATTQPRSKARGCPRPHPALVLLSALLLVGATACVGDDDEPTLLVGEDATTSADTPASDPPVATPRTAIDILFVVDDSASMAQEQATLSSALPEFLERLYALAEERGAAADVHVGVVSTDMGTAGFDVATCGAPAAGADGCLRSTPSPWLAGCDSAYPTFLSRRTDDGEAYPVDDLAADFACIGTLGTAGCGFEQQLAAGRRALTDQAEAGGCNQGFLRPGSVVAVIHVTDEDDCTVDPAHPELFDVARTELGHLNLRCFLHPDLLTPVSGEVAALRALEEAGHEVVVGALVGVPLGERACTGFGDELGACLDARGMQAEIDPAQPSQLLPSCNTAMGLAFPPRRFVQLAQAFGDRAYVSSLCAADYNDPLVRLAGRIIQAL